jgi:site-specific recombinase XerD
MASVKLYYDKRRLKKDGTYPLKLKINHNDKALYIPLGRNFTPKQWSEKDNKVKSSFPNSGEVNASIRKALSNATTLIAENQDEIKHMSIKALKELLQKKLFDDKKSSPANESDFFYKYTQSLIDRLIVANRVGTADSYRQTLTSFQKFLDHKDIPLNSIDNKFILDYEAYCLGKGMKINSIGVYLRTLRAILNKAIGDGLLNKNNYAFSNYSIKVEKTAKRAISKEEIQKIISLELEQGTKLWNSHNYFVFMFHLRGMNFIDLAYLTPKNIIEGRVEYRRIKTGKLYSIKLTEKAKSILDYYMNSQSLKPSDYIFPILPKGLKNDKETERKRFKDKRKNFNKDLKVIAKQCDIEVNLTSYVTRHTWASIAKFAGIAPAIIGESLGHSDLKTTETYLANFENKELDDANELIVG